ncbi:MAG TPA: cytochrome c biogenesis protein CcdA [Thermodesulfobacteriota bacterium]|nr:cytochrome c biogenesis protein CcdA [Thermodesulfobacteriota bacterium]
MSGSQDLSLYIAFGAGLLSFLSPCVLPLVPSYLAFITGLSFEELTQEENKGRRRRTIFLHSLMFGLGFSTLFTALGASATYLGQFLSAHRDTIRVAGGILIILFGLFISGVFSFNFLQREKKLHLQSKPLGFLGSFLVGLTFAAGWTPCVGPILSSILLFASTQQEIWSGILLLLAYSLGLGVPFLICSLALNTFLNTFRKTARHMGVITKVGGALLILVGIILLTDSFSYLSELFNQLFPGASVG